MRFEQISELAKYLQALKADPGHSHLELAHPIRALVVALHPDRNPGDPHAAQASVIATQAMDACLRPELFNVNKYDTMLATLGGLMDELSPAPASGTRSNGKAESGPQRQGPNNPFRTSARAESVSEYLPFPDITTQDVALDENIVGKKMYKVKIKGLLSDHLSSIVSQHFGVEPTSHAGDHYECLAAFEIEGVDGVFLAVKSFVGKQLNRFSGWILIDGRGLRAMQDKKLLPPDPIIRRIRDFGTIQKIHPSMRPNGAGKIIETQVQGDLASLRFGTDSTDPKHPVTFCDIV